jgi:hypothetical protein
MKAKKKDDYGLFCFRLSTDERKELGEMLNKAKTRLNRGRPKNVYVITKNQIILEAIKLGLPLVKKER